MVRDVTTERGALPVIVAIVCRMYASMGSMLRLTKEHENTTHVRVVAWRALLGVARRGKASWLVEPRVGEAGVLIGEARVLHPWRLVGAGREH